MSIKNLIVILSFSFIVIYCTESSLNSEKKTFLNTLWILESYEISGKIITPTEGQVYNILFSSDSTFIGQSDCNEINGKYIILENNKIEILEILTTKKYCGEDSSGENYVSAISESHTFDINDIKLFLSYGTQNSRMTFISK